MSVLVGAVGRPREGSLRGSPQQHDGLAHRHDNWQSHRHDTGSHRRPTEPTRGVAVDVGDGRGALILYAAAEREWCEPEIHPVGEPENRQHVWVLERLVRDGSVYAAVFPSLPEGTYGICSPEGATVQEIEIVSGEVATARWA